MKYIVIVISFVALSLAQNNKLPQKLKHCPDNEWHFAALSDSRGSDGGINEGVLRDLRNSILADSAIEFIFYPGDMTSTGTVSEVARFKTIFLDPIRSAGLEFYSVAGNHEYLYGSHDDNYQTFLNLPEQKGLGLNHEGKTYTFKKHNALLVGFDWYSNELEQKWFEGEVDKSGATHIFSMSHMPLWKAQHAEEYNPQARDTFINYVTAHGGRTFFSGHDHFYDHSKVVAKNGAEFHQFIVGTAGASLYDFDGKVYGRSDVTQVKFIKEFGYAVITVNGNKASIVYKMRHGSEFVVADTYEYMVPCVKEK